MDNSIGPAFRRAREQHGLSLPVVADHLGVSTAMLESVEQGRIQQETVSVAAKAHIRLYGRFLGFDAESILAGNPPGSPSTAGPAAALAAGRPAAASAPPQPERAVAPPQPPLPPSPRPGLESTTPAPPPPAPPPPRATPSAGSQPPLKVGGDERRANDSWSGPSATAAAPAPASSQPKPPAGGFFEEPDDLDDLHVGGDEDVGDEDADDSRRRLRALLTIAVFLVAGLVIGLLVSTAGGPPTGELQGAADAETTVDVVPDQPVPAEPEIPEGMLAPDPPEPTDEPLPTSSPEPDTAAPPDAEGVTVQVLDGARDTERYETIIAYLEGLGYTVTGSGPSGPSYAETTIFYTDGNDELAGSLAAFDPRFTVVIENNRGLTEFIDLHVVIGADWTEDDVEAGDE